MRATLLLTLFCALLGVTVGVASAQSDREARRQGTEQLLFGQRVARDDLKLAIGALQAELAGATQPGARAEIERRIATTVNALNQLRVTQAAELEARARETVQLEQSYAAERASLEAAERAARIEASERAREEAQARADAIALQRVDEETQRANQALVQAIAQRDDLSRRQSAAEAASIRIAALQEKLPDLLRRAQATTYLDERAKLEQEAAAIQTQIAQERAEFIAIASR